jgi:formate-dependent nitrite reductase cytochrome c552 subunit
MGPGPAFKLMDVVAVEWSESAHANSYHTGDHGNDNTYCARCHSPFQADPAATYTDNDPVAAEDWEGVTCSSCHGPHTSTGRVTGNYDIVTGQYIDRHGDFDALCEYCHTGSRHGIEYQGFGKIMHKKTDLGCVDCHMPEDDTYVRDGEEKDIHSHSFQPNAASCGLDDPDCHPNHTDDWAEKQIEKGIHDKGSYGQIKDKDKGE